MSNYLKLTSGNPIQYSLEKLYSDNPNVSFPEILSDNLLKSWDIYPYTRPLFPLYNSLIEKVLDGDFIEDKDGNWIQEYKIESLPKEQIENNIRNQRNYLIQETDWTALSDVTMTPAMAIYRQSLRDVTLQEGFPTNVIWPTKPA